MQDINIKSGIQLLVEGNDPRNFFEAFINHLSLAEDIQVQNFGGVNELSGFLRALANAPKFRTVQSIGIVRDAETSAQSAFQSVQSLLRNANLPVPSCPEERTDTHPAVTVLILPGNNREGVLETLLCKSFEDTPENCCIDDFFKCVESLPDRDIKQPDKARAHAYLTTKLKAHHSVGVAAKQGYWDLDHKAFDNIRIFLKMIAKNDSGINFNLLERHWKTGRDFS